MASVDIENVRKAYGAQEVIHGASIAIPDAVHLFDAADNQRLN